MTHQNLSLGKWLKLLPVTLHTKGNIKPVKERVWRGQLQFTIATLPKGSCVNGLVHFS